MENKKHNSPKSPNEPPQKLQKVDDNVPSSNSNRLEKLPKWKTLSHEGIDFEPYEPHTIPILYDGSEIQMGPSMEERATAWVKTSENCRNDPIFRTNFFDDWKKSFPSDCPIKSLEKCDFSRIEKHIKENPSKSHASKYAIFDGVKNEYNPCLKRSYLHTGTSQKKKNYGKFVRGIMLDDITINIGEEANLPSHPSGGVWKTTQDKNSTYIAKYNCPLTKKLQYIKLKDSSPLKQKKTKETFDKVRQLKYEKFLKEAINAMKSEDNSTQQQIGVCVYLILMFSFRPGSEKNENETYGITTLKHRHVSLSREPQVLTPGTVDMLFQEWKKEIEKKISGNNYITFNFLGKKKVLYNQTLKIDKKPFELIQSILNKENSSPEKDLFDIKTKKLNDWIKKIQPGITAKCIRTYNASLEIEKYLKKKNFTGKTLKKKKEYFKRGNLRIAKMLNHKKDVEKDTTTKINNKINSLNAKKQKLKNRLKRRQDNEPESDDEYEFKKVTDAQKRKLKIEEDLEYPKMEEFKEENAKELKQNPKAMVNILVIDKKNALHKWQPIKHKTAKQTQKSIKNLNKQIEKQEIKICAKKLSNYTSKKSYIDPRIVFSWCKRNNVEVEDVYSPGLIKKFSWAKDTPEDFEFLNLEDVRGNLFDPHVNIEDDPVTKEEDDEE
ncbi:hypothetical protein PCE1_002786 [Barthelona sp. PCE]